MTLPKAQARTFVHTMMHEYAHNKVKFHDEQFAGEIARLYTIVDEQKYVNLIQVP